MLRDRSRRSHVTKCGPRPSPVARKRAGRAGALGALAFATFATAALAALPARDAQAQSARPRAVATGPNYVFDSPAAEGLVIAGGLASLSTFLLPQRITTWGAASYVADELVFGGVSDITGAGIGTAIQLASGFVIESMHYASVGMLNPYPRSLRTSLVEGEAILYASAVSFIVKRLSGRCRPRTYRDGRCAEKDGQHDAFPSGHVTPVATVAAARLTFALHGGPGRSYRYGSFAFAESATLVTAWLRMRAGAHSWEDVLGGLLLGHATGALVSLLHPFTELDERGERIPARVTSQTASPASTSFNFGGAF